MGIFIKNPETERKARELARLRGDSLTAVIDAALEDALVEERAKSPRRATADEIEAASVKLRAAIGLDRKPQPPVLREEFDALWED